MQAAPPVGPPELVGNEEGKGREGLQKTRRETILWSMNTQRESADASELFCLNESCPARGKQGEGNIVSHGTRRPRWRCSYCGKTFAERSRTLFEGLRKPEAEILQVVTLLAYGCPRQAIVKAFGLDERTVARWQERAGQQSERVHQGVVVQAGLDGQQVQADEIRVKGVKWIAWMGLAVMVSTRLWLAGEVSFTRDTALADHLLAQVRACLRQGLETVLVVTDGWNAYVGSIRRTFREKVPCAHPQGGRPGWRLWEGLVIGQIVKRHGEVRGPITREVTSGSEAAAVALIEQTQGKGGLNTAFIERFNGTMRQRLACLGRRSRHAGRRLESLRAGMYLVGCTYNFCWPHHQLSRGAGLPCTPALAAGLTDHIWSLEELMRLHIPPPPLPPPARKRGRPPKPLPPVLLRKPRGRPPNAGRAAS